MLNVRDARFRCRIARDQSDVEATLIQRAASFHPEAGQTSRDALISQDRDEFDPHFSHMLVEEISTGQLVGSFRYRLAAGGDGPDKSYSGQFYDLGACCEHFSKSLEIGRFCVDPSSAQMDVLRSAWAAITSIGLAENVEFLFGCSSFVGQDPLAFGEAFRLLAQNHQAPVGFGPGVKADSIFPYVQEFSEPPEDRARAVSQIPPMLRTYLAMNGWVSDHAVIDHALGTIHVFTGLEVAKIPEARLQSLHRLASENCYDLS